MSIDLIIEDGTGVEGANTWADVDVARVFAAQRDVTLSSDDDTVAGFLIRSMDYLQGFDNRWRGVPAFPELQVIPFPRIGFIDGAERIEPYLPWRVAAAQIMLAMAVSQGIDLQPNTAPSGDLPVIREKVGPLETEYATPAMLGGAAYNTPSVPAAMALLKPLFKPMQLRTVRI